ncbi:flagellar hook-associated protein FlgK [Anaerosacchariphilus polymeriproducens]|uniref:Flagellar hook-associated protein 1 n=1 Tax=Anaerosacchariphilus polymeriproducens TaxID=1812858 RepID=A0A371AQQ6_9FIRM|nr:flagellar hook-associated protein FlgK [Anaerosacchariphilus polymeriproducens]RDU21903.1 flagellar hook-associated protein FlgK [Anaerosacchariphilus polymeriproducens]
MASTFFGLTIASSGLTTYQAALNTTGNNIANVHTKGYSRQQTIRHASEAIRANNKYGMVGSGVTTDSVMQIRDQYYDLKYWYNQAKVGEYDTKYYYAQQIENYFIDDKTQKGFSTIFDEMYAALEEVQKSPANPTVRNQFISSAESLAEYFNSVSEGMTKIQSDANEEIRNKVQQINSISQEISVLNKQINVIEIAGGYANELRDQRASLVDDLSKIVPVDIKETNIVNSNDSDMYTGATNYKIEINGQVLVDGNNYNQLEVIARENKINQTDIEGLYDVYWVNGDKINFNTTAMNGEIKALFDTRDGNDADNFSGKVSSIKGNIVYLAGCNMTSDLTMSMAETGTIKIGSKEYEYTGFTNNGDGTYRFSLNTNLTSDEIAKAIGTPAQIGESIDYMGIPYYMSQLNFFVRNYTKTFNEIHSSGEDINGNQAGDFFTAKDSVLGTEMNLNASEITSTSNSYYKMTAGNITVRDALLNDPTLMSTATDVANGVDATDIVDKLMTLKTDKSVISFRGGTSEDFLQYILSDIAVDTQRAKTFSTNYTNISKAVINQRISVSGVDEDEEAMDLIKFQNAYNLSSKVVQVLTEMYDRLILQTGV